MEPPSDSALLSFLTKYPAYTATLEQLRRLRKEEYDRLGGSVYLDYTAACLYPRSLVEEHHRWLLAVLAGNPHSDHMPSVLSTKHEEEARAAVLSFFNASPKSFDVIWTANASAALRLVGESFPFDKKSTLLLSADNHNSANGIREFAAKKGATVKYLALNESLQISPGEALHTIKRGSSKRMRHLFVFPAQSNSSGVQHDLKWVSVAQELGWRVCLDAAAFVPTNRLNLGQVRPDFVPISFYKMFGYPTGIGCLIVKLSALTELNRPWFSGGTVEGVSILAEKHVLKSSHDGFHDGTTNFLAMHAVERGLAWLTGIGIDTIHQRVMALTTFLVQEMTALRHQETGRALIRIAGMSRSGADGGVLRRGGTIAFNLYDLNGIWINSEIVALQASKRQLYLREGCFCNPGVAETEFKLSKSALCECFTAPTAPPRQTVAVLTKSQSVRNLTAANANSSSQRVVRLVVNGDEDSSVAIPVVESTTLRDVFLVAQQQKHALLGTESSAWSFSIMLDTSRTLSNRAWDATLVSLGHPQVLHLVRKKENASNRKSRHYATTPIASSSSSLVLQSQIKKCFSSRGFESGLVRASLGVASSFEDCRALVIFLKEFLLPANVARWRQEFEDNLSRKHVE